MHVLHKYLTGADGFQVSPWICLSIWLILGYFMIIFNKTLLSVWNFGFPFLLTAWHCLISSIFTQILARTTNLLPAVNENKITSAIYYRKILPIAFFFAFGLAAGNSAYKYLSVAYIQMLKSFTPVPMLLGAFISGREKLSMIQLSLVLMISFGVCLASAGELQFSLVGFILQISAMLADVSRMSLTDIVLSELKLDTLSMLYYMMPLSCMFISIGFIINELPRFSMDILSTELVSVIILSGIMAFALNIAVILAIKNVSTVTLALAGLFKDVILVISSIIIFRSPVTLLQYYGYSISVIGMNLYREYRKDPTTFPQRMYDLTKQIFYFIIARKEKSDADNGKEEGVSLISQQSVTKTDIENHPTEISGIHTVKI